MTYMVPPRPVAQKPPKLNGKDPAYLAKIHDLPCAVCHHHGLPQLSPTQAHHPIHGRHGFLKVPDRMAVPLCEGHHQGLWDTSKVSVHGEPALWRELYGKDTDYIAWSQDSVEGKA